MDERTWLERDKKDYAIYYQEASAKLKAEYKMRNNFKLNGFPFKKKWHSFDGDLLRDPYDDMTPMSDFNSEISHESVPHQNPLRLKNPEYQARLELFR